MDAVSDLQGLVKQLTLERNSARNLYDKVYDGTTASALLMLILSPRAGPRWFLPPLM